MKRIDRYLMKEMIAPFLISTVVVVMMFQANQLMAIYRDPNINMDRVPFLATLQLLLLKTPAWLQLTLPFGIALGSSLCVSRIARESELVAMRSAGIPIRRVLRPVIIAGILAALLNFVVTEQVMPRAEKASKRLLSQIGQLALQPTLKSNVSVTIGGWIASIGTVSRGPGGSLVLDRVLLNQKDYNGEETVVQADKGSYNNGIWTFQKPILRIFKGPNLTQVTSKAEMSINQPISVEDFIGSREVAESSLEELRLSIANGKKAKLQTRKAEIEYYFRYSLPASCAVFGLTGSVLAVIFARVGPFAGVMLSLCMAMLYYNAFMVAKEIIGPNGWLSPIMTAWLPNAIFLLIGLVLLWRSE